LGEEERAGPGLRPQRDLVRHRRSRQEERRLVAEQARDPLLQRVHRRILQVLLVAHLGGDHRREHRLGRLRERVRTKIDHEETLAFVATMRFGLQLCTLGSFADPRETVRVARAAEAAGWEALLVWTTCAGRLR